MSDPRTEIGELWRHISWGVHDRLREAFRGQELNPIAMIMLREIKLEPGVTVNELARRSRTVKSHVSKMIDQLVQQGFVEKRADPDDQRLLRIYMTQSAAQTLSEVEARVQAIWAEIINEVPAPDLADLSQSLRVLLSALERSQGQTAKSNPLPCP